MPRIRQVAYFVPDVRQAALRHHAVFGSGPYYVADNIALRACRYRGAPAELDHSSAYGQWGDVMVEFVQQNNAAPSAFHDMYPRGGARHGFHHVAVFVDNLAAAIAAHEAKGHALALYAEMHSGFAFAMVDTVAEFGHMTELYRPEPVLVDFYAMVAVSAGSFGGGMLRPISLS